MDAAQEGFGSNPFAALSGSGSSTNTSGNVQQGRENTEPLPNPWAAPSSTPAAGSGGSGTGGGSATTTSSSSGTTGGTSQTTTAGMPAGEALVRSSIVL